MTTALQQFVAQDLAAEVSPEVDRAVRQLAEQPDAVAILFYGSVLRTGALGDVLDFYVLTDRAPAFGALASRWLWPDVSYRELRTESRTIRAKVATMPLSIFERAAHGNLVDTTIWTRFTQPSALVWSRTPNARLRVHRAVADAIVTAGRFAALLGPGTGRPGAFWQSLFRQTYETELRVEAPGREKQIIGHAPERYERLLPLAWDAGGVAYRAKDGQLTPSIGFAAMRDLTEAWMVRAAVGRLVNAARLAKAAFTFEGAARYGLWKIERHTGIHVPLTPWRERHPVLAAPGVLWQVMRAETH